LVDDAIIVGERVHTFQTQGMPPLEGAIRGTREVALPVTLAVLTTMVAFLPGLSLPGWAGRMTYPICMVMILTVLFSLVEALLILPSHLAAPLASADARPSAVERIRSRLNGGVERFVDRIYRPCLDTALRWRYLTVSIFIAAMLLVAALPYSGRVRVALEADVTRDYFRVELLLPPGSPPAERRALAKRVETALYSLRDELDRGQPPGTPSVVAHLETLILERPVYLYVEFSPEARQRQDMDTLMTAWRERIGDIGNARITFLYRQGETAHDIVLELSADDGDTVTRAATQLKQTLVAYPGVYDVGDSYEPGKPEIRLKLKPEAARLGLRLRDVAEQVHAGFYGEEVQRFQRHGEEVKVVVRLPLAQRSSLEHLISLPLRLPSGESAPLGNLAEVSFAPGYATLIRQDRRRLVEVHARVDARVADVNAIYADLEQNVLTRLQRDYPALRTNVGQQRLEQEAMAETLLRNTAIALIVIYALIAVPFRSYFKPLIFLLAAPVAWCGAIFAHWVIGLSLSMESLVGMIAASGVVVNDSLVLLDYINERGDTSEPVADLIRQACTSRFRP
ncbi:MAG: efflux RND transporter permease subunit, partial [Gammaproteobacteria bacterium]|nr:efflux RND transporter permease subunit [Gammaproteobacteria bacterium]